MNGSSIRRVQYFERQYLRTQDFTDEQAYHVAMRRRHNIAHHSWGIVYGLQLEYDTAASVFIVHPGMAIDGYGRELILAKNYDILVNEFALRDRSTLDVWLRYERKAVSPAPSGYGASGRHGETPHYRWQELAIVTLTPAAFDSDRRKPEGVAAGDLDFSPNRMPPDEPTLEWPVYLGQIRRDLADAENPYKVDLRGRPYAGLVGEAIRAPSGRALVQLGTDPAAEGRRFAVYVAPGSRSPEDAVTPSLAVEEGGEIEVYGQTSLHGNLVVKGGTAQPGTIFFNETNPFTAQPWRLYRALTISQLKETKRENGSSANGQPPDRVHVLDQLRIEMARGGQGHNQVVIGVWSAEDPNNPRFVPCLTVRDDHTVTVHGNLVVEGQLIEKQVRPEPKVTGEARAIALSNTLSGISGTGTILGQFYAQRRRADVAVLLRDAKSVQQVFDALPEGSKEREAFLTQLAVDENDDLQLAIIDGLQPRFVKVSLSDGEHVQVLFDEMPDGSNERAYYLGQLVDPQNSSLQHATFIALLAPFLEFLLGDGAHIQLLFEAMPDNTSERTRFLEQLAEPQNSSLQRAIFIALLTQLLEFLLGDGAHIQSLFDAMSGDDGADERARFLTQLAEDQNASLQTAIVPILVENQPSAVADALLQAPGGAQTVMEQILDGESDLPLQTFLTGLSTDLYTNPQRLNRFVDQLMLDEFEPLRTALVNALQS